MAKAKDLTVFIGIKYNYLTVIKESNKIKTSGGNSKRRLLCSCECGIIKDYDWQSVINGNIKSCGCYSRKIASNRMKIMNNIHGQFNTPEYNSWQSMKKRCLNKTHKAYNDYGGRGITVCKRWIESFENFLNDMGSKPSKSHSLDRINNNDGYYKENCRWATQKQQCQNQRTNRNIEFEGKIKCISEWARILNMSTSKLYYRLIIAKYPIEKAFKI